MVSIKREELKKEIEILKLKIKYYEEQDLNLNNNISDIKYVSNRLKEAKKELELKIKQLHKVV